MKVRELITIIEGHSSSPKKSLEREIKEVRIDSRQVKKGDVFLALKGKEKDGHDYVREVIKKKPSCIIVKEGFDMKVNIPVIQVSDTLEALHKLASYHRRQFNGIVIGITGSCGKTTTKDMLSHLLETKYKVLKSEKNYNNHIGVPLTLLKLTNDYDVLVIECGTNHPGELETLGELVKPDLVLITNIGTSHIGNFKNKKAILKEKLSLINSVKEGVLILNGDDPLLRKVKKRKMEIYQTYNKKSVLNLKTIYCLFERSIIKFEYMNRDYHIELMVPGKGMVDNLLLSMECALFLNIDINVLLDSISTITLEKERLEKIPLKNNNYLIRDCYNASFESVEGLLSILKPLPEQKIIILGDMKELGKYSKKLHMKIGKQLKKIEYKKVYLVGDECKYIAKLDSTFKWFPNNQSLVEALHKEVWKDSIIAVKGAHSMRLNEVCDDIIDCY